MSITGVGPALAVEGPLPAAHAYNLTTVASPLTQALDELGGDLERWRNGISLRAYPFNTPGGFDPCSTGTFREKDDGDDAVINTFLPFTGYIAEHCSSWSVGPWAEFQARANAVMTETEAYALEKQLVSGYAIDTNPYLSDANLTMLGSGAVTPREGLAYLEQAIGGLTGRAGVIHAGPDVAAAWSSLGYTLERTSAGTLRTVGNWTPVIVGSGYVGSVFIGSGDVDAPEVDPGATQSLVYATGPVVYARSNALIAVPETERQAVDRDDNTVTYRAERDLIVAWDTILQVAVLIDWSECPCSQLV